MSAPHVHAWTLINAALGRYRCACGVYGHRPTIVSLRNPKDREVKPYLCQAELGESRTHCSKQATHVTGTRTASRCESHAPAAVHVNGTSLGAARADESIT